MVPVCSVLSNELPETVEKKAFPVESPWVGSVDSEEERMVKGRFKELGSESFFGDYLYERAMPTEAVPRTTRSRF